MSPLQTWARLYNRRYHLREWSDKERLLRADIIKEYPVPLSWFEPNSNIRNSFPRDERIVFEPIAHTYFVDGYNVGYASASKLVEFFFGEFPGAAAAVNCAKTRNPGYYQNLNTTADVFAFWDAIRNAGTARHAAMDRFLQAEPPLEQTVPDNEASGDNLVLPPPLGFFKLLELHPDWKPYRSEYSMFDDKYRIAGQADAIFIDGKGNLILVDWKNVKSIEISESKKGCHPLTAHMDACNYNKYWLQTNLYMYLFRVHTGKRIAAIYLCNFSWMTGELDERIIPMMDDPEMFVRAFREANPFTWS